jgi:hypothetical protein
MNKAPAAMQILYKNMDPNLKVTNIKVILNNLIYYRTQVHKQEEPKGLIDRLFFFITYGSHYILILLTSIHRINLQNKPSTFCLLV